MSEELSELGSSEQEWRYIPSLHQMGGFTSHYAEVTRELGSKCVPQLCLRSYLGTRWSAIGQLFSLSLVTVPDVFGKVISAQFPPQLSNPSISKVFIVNSVECA